MPGAKPCRCRHAAGLCRTQHGRGVDPRWALSGAGAGQHGLGGPHVPRHRPSRLAGGPWGPGLAGWARGTGDAQGSRPHSASAVPQWRGPVARPNPSAASPGRVVRRSCRPRHAEHPQLATLRSLLREMRQKTLELHPAGIQLNTLTPSALAAAPREAPPMGAPTPGSDSLSDLAARLSTANSPGEHRITEQGGLDGTSKGPPSPTPLQLAGTSSPGPGCSEPCPAWP